jgi:hypothetical protein
VLAGRISLCSRTLFENTWLHGRATASVCHRWIQTKRDRTSWSRNGKRLRKPQFGLPAPQRHIRRNLLNHDSHNSLKHDTQQLGAFAFGGVDSNELDLSFPSVLPVPL